MPQKSVVEKLQIFPEKNSYSNLLEKDIGIFYSFFSKVSRTIFV